MPKLTHSETTRFSKQQIFDLVADVPSYPDFIPWCLAARVIEQESEQVFLAELVIGFKGITERYTSRVTLDPYKGIRAEMVSGPFHHLINDWQFRDVEDGRTEIHLDLDFEFRGSLLNRVIGGVFGKASSKMISAFRERANALYS
jgi:coenzyme Q-binding protein COQ10